MSHDHQRCESRKEPRNLFAPGDVVRHRKGSTYYVLGRCTVEATLADCYSYRGEDGRVWVRPALEMEDGRFTLVYEAPKALPSESTETMTDSERYAKFGTLLPLGERPKETDAEIIAGDTRSAEGVSGAFANVLRIVNRYPWHHDLDAAMQELATALSAIPSATRTLMTPEERKELIRWHEWCAPLCAQTDDFGGESYHKRRAAELRSNAADSRRADG